MGAERIPVFFHRSQLAHNPRYEWFFGKRLLNMETSLRADAIAGALSGAPDDFDMRVPEEIPVALIKKTHDARLLTVLRVASELDPDTTFYPSVFPKHHQTRPDPLDLNQSGYFCFDAGTALTSKTLEVASWSAASAVEAAKLVASGRSPLAYGLCRPPGHHASGDLFGGYCYLNNAALVATQLRRKGTVAIVDIDLHHGNGTQALFYRDPNVLFISVHGDPRVFYPYFSGYANETGAEAGQGFNINLPQPRGCDFNLYKQVLEARVLPAVRGFDPASLVISAGFDTYHKDPIRGFKLDTPHYHAIGELLGSLHLPTVVVQEGGYCAAQLGTNVANFLLGLRDGTRGPLKGVARRPNRRSCR
jgi:acetoin utilization deacetylase AcuC-like enzyme